MKTFGYILGFIFPAYFLGTMLGSIIINKIKKDPDWLEKVSSAPIFLMMYLFSIRYLKKKDVSLWKVEVMKDFPPLYHTYKRENDFREGEIIMHTFSHIFSNFYVHNFNSFNKWKERTVRPEDIIPLINSEQHIKSLKSISKFKL